MARPGDQIVNEKMGARIVFLRTAAETSGDLLQFDFFVRPHKGVASEHLHPRQVEGFEVLAGTMRGRVGGEERTVPTGGSVAVPPGTPHIWWNDDAAGEAHLRVEFRPALETEVFFETVFGLARTGKGGAHGLPRNVLQLAVLLDAYREEVRPLDLPAPVHALMVTAVAPVGRLLGYRERYPEFSAPDERMAR